jgi:hypothetical protein
MVCIYELRKNSTLILLLIPCLLCCTGKKMNATDPLVIHVPAVSSVTDISKLFDIRIIEIPALSVLNIKKVLAHQHKLYISGHDGKTSLWVYDPKSDEVNKLREFDPHQITLVDFAITFPEVYILSSRKLHVFNLLNNSYTHEIQLTKPYSALSVFRNDLLFAAFSSEGIPFEAGGYYRISVADRTDYKIVDIFDWYKLQPVDAGRVTAMMHPSVPFTQNDDNLFYTKFFCDSVFRFNDTTRNFQFYRYIQFPHAITYEKYSDLSNDVEKFNRFAERGNYETGIFFFHDSEKFTFFQFVANGKPAFYFYSKQNHGSFATLNMYHKNYGKNLPFPEFVMDHHLCTILTENTLEKNPVEGYNDELKRIIQNIIYEGKTYIFMYILHPDGM